MIISTMAFRVSVVFIDRNWLCSFYLALRCNEPIPAGETDLDGFEFGISNVQETAQIGFLKTPG